eukprot:3919128-Lingulodinium_polyedra.AAC.1
MGLRLRRFLGPRAARPARPAPQRGARAGPRWTWPTWISRGSSTRPSARPTGVGGGGGEREGHHAFLAAVVAG